MTLRFQQEQLVMPLLLSSGAISEVPYARVTIYVCARLGRISRGDGGILGVFAYPPEKVH